MRSQPPRAACARGIDFAPRRPDRLGSVVRIRLFLLLAAAFFGTASAAQAASVRVFAVGNKQRVADAVSYQAYRDKMSALMDKSFPNRSNFVQPGVDDVASHVQPADPSAPRRALAVFPEDVGLVAALIGSRGAVARQQTSTDLAIISLFGPYSAQTTYYANKFPGLIGIRTLSVAITDTLYRSFY